MSPVTRAEASPRRKLRLATNFTILVLSISVLVEALEMPFGSSRNPDSGFWPVVISAVLLCLCLLLVVTERDESDYASAGMSLRVVGSAIFSLVIFVVLFTKFGFAVPALLLMVFWLHVLGGESWRLTTVVSVLLVSGFHLLFVEILEVPFPEGVLAVLWGG